MLKGKEFGAAIARAIQLKLDSGAAKTKAEIARHFGMKPPSLADWVKKGSVAKDKLPELWRYFSDVAGPDHWGMTKSEWPAGLTDGRDADHGNDNLDRPLLPSSNSSSPPASLDSNLTPGPAMKGRVPLISSVQAGMWAEIIDNFQPGDAEAWVECHRDLGSHGYALRVKGESMTAPTGEYSFPHGMILYVNPSAEPLPGKFVVVRRNGHEATFKRLTLVDGEMYLEAINPDWPNRYIKLTPDDHICGVVVYAGLELP